MLDTSIGYDINYGLEKIAQYTEGKLGDESLDTLVINQIIDNYWQNADKDDFTAFLDDVIQYCEKYKKIADG